MRQYQIGAVVLEMRADIVFLQDFAVDGKRHVAFFIQQVERRDVKITALLDNLMVHGDRCAAAAVRGVAFHDRPVEFLHEILDERGAEVVGLHRFARADLHADFAVRLPAERFVGADKPCGRDVLGEIDDGSLLVGHLIITGGFRCRGLRHRLFICIVHLCLAASKQHHRRQSHP